MINHETFQIIKQLNRRVVAIPPVHIDMTGSLAGGYLLSQVFYWAEKKDFGEFYKTDVEFCEELHINIRQLKGAKKLLTDSGIVKIVRKGIPAKSYYQLDIEEYARQITSYDKTSQLVDTKRHNLMIQNVTTNTETTTEITTDNIYNAREAKRRSKISLENLSVDHIKEWISEKRITGSYIDCDEHLILEKFKNYCLSKGKKYEDYVAAYRNAFEWDSNKSTGNAKQGNRKSKSDDYDSAFREGLVGTVPGQGGLRDLLS